MRSSLYIASIYLFLSLFTACSKQTADSYYQQGKHFREANQPVEAMRSFIAATCVRSSEFTIRGRSFSNMATMCRICEQHETAYALYAKSLEQFALAEDSLAQAYALNNMAWEKAVLSDKKAALDLIASALSVCSEPPVQSKILESHAAACLYAGEYDSTLYYCRLDTSLSVYLDILRAQAHTFLFHNDSALLYARRVLQQTDNPRYLDDVYFILSHCDSAAVADDIRALASSRTDIQRALERNDPEWMEAVRLAQSTLAPPSPRFTPRQIVLSLSAVLLVLVTVFCVWFIRHRARTSTLEAQCRALRKSASLRDELHWNDYPQFSAVCNARLSGIVGKLEQKGLSEREIRICVLVLIGFSYAEIAQILFRAESGIGKDKYTIAKHLGVSVKQLRETLLSIAFNHA